MSTETSIRKFYDVVVIGGGQAGLAAGYYLKNSLLSFTILDSEEQIGDSWRKRFDSLTLFTSREFSSLPGLDLEGDSSAYPGKDEMADYLQRYAKTFQLPVENNAPVVSLRQEGDEYTVEYGEQKNTIQCKAVIIATGAFQRSKIPAYAGKINEKTAQFSLNDYKNPEQLNKGSVLVVGDGASGRQIALKLVKSRNVILATGKTRKISPQRILGKDLFWWLNKLSILTASSQSLIGRILRKKDPFPGRHLSLSNLRQQGVLIKPRAVGVINGELTLRAGERMNVDNIIWTAGFEEHNDWLKIPGMLDREGRLMQSKGATALPNIKTLGRSWQTCRGSALLCGVGKDAEKIVSQLVNQLGAREIQSDDVVVSCS